MLGHASLAFIEVVQAVVLQGQAPAAPRASQSCGSMAQGAEP